jgi:hypothetical protein
VEEYERLIQALEAKLQTTLTALVSTIQRFLTDHFLTPSLLNRSFLRHELKKPRKWQNKDTIES